MKFAVVNTFDKFYYLVTITGHNGLVDSDVILKLPYIVVYPDEKSLAIHGGIFILFNTFLQQLCMNCDCCVLAR